MKITTAKEFMKVIAKHYEECRTIYWDAMSGSGMFDRRIVTLKGLPEDPVDRQGVAIMYAVLAAPILESGEAELEVDKDALQEVHERFAALMAIEKFIAHGYLEWDKDKKDEDGFPVISVIVPPDEWDVN